MKTLCAIWLALLFGASVVFTANAYTTNAPGHTTNTFSYTTNAPNVSTNGSNVSSNAPSVSGGSSGYSTNAPGVRTNGVSASTNAPPAIAPLPVLVFTGTNSNPNGLYSAGRGSIYVQLNSQTNLVANWFKTTFSGATGWQAASSGGGLTALTGAGSVTVSNLGNGTWRIYAPSNSGGGGISTTGASYSLYTANALLKFTNGVLSYLYYAPDSPNFVDVISKGQTTASIAYPISGMGGGTDKMYVYRSTDNSSFSYVYTINLPYNDNVFNDSGLSPGTTYYYKTRGWNTNYGYGSYSSAAISVTTDPTPPAQDFTGSSSYFPAGLTDGDSFSISGADYSLFDGNYTYGSGQFNGDNGYNITWVTDHWTINGGDANSNTSNPNDPSGYYSGGSGGFSIGGFTYSNVGMNDNLSWTDNSGGTATFYVTGPSGEIFRGTGSSCSTTAGADDGGYSLYAVSESGDIYIGHVTLRGA